MVKIAGTPPPTVSFKTSREPCSRKTLSEVLNSIASGRRPCACIQDIIEAQKAVWRENPVLAVVIWNVQRWLHTKIKQSTTIGDLKGKYHWDAETLDVVGQDIESNFEVVFAYTRSWVKLYFSTLKDTITMKDI